jgi:hypothetical protein
LQHLWFSLINPLYISMISIIRSCM